MKILTILPRSWSIKKAAKVFDVSRYFIRQAKMLVAEKGIMSSPNPKSSRTLPAHTEEEITDFYLSDDISRVMQGKKRLYFCCPGSRRKAGASTKKASSMQP